MANVPERLIQLLEKQTGKTFDHLDRNTPLETLGIDSFDFIEFLFMVEDEFGIAVDYRANDFSGRLKTVGDVVAIVEELTTARPADVRFARMAHA